MFDYLKAFDSGIKHKQQRISGALIGVQAGYRINYNLWHIIFYELKSAIIIHPQNNTLLNNQYWIKYFYGEDGLMELADLLNVLQFLTKISKLEVFW